MSKVVININTTAEEQRAVMEAIKRLNSLHPAHTALAISTIAHESHLSPNRVRYIVLDLVESGKVRRDYTKAFNEHYVRYCYTVLDQ